MAKLTAKKRSNMDKSDFGLPGARKFPMPDKSHAANAKSRASEAEKKGKISKKDKQKIDAKADKVIAGKAKKPAKSTAAKSGSGKITPKNTASQFKQEMKRQIKTKNA